MPGQLERELHARRIFRKALVDAELEDRRRGPGGAARSPAATGVVAGAQRDDLALRGFGQRRNGAADEGRIAFMLDQRGAALALPAAGFELQECFERGPTSSGLRATSKRDGAVLCEAMALPAQLLELLGAERLVQQRRRRPASRRGWRGCRIEDARLQAVAVAAPP